MAQPTLVRDLDTNLKVTQIRHTMGYGSPTDDVIFGLNDIDKTPLYSTYQDCIALPGDDQPVMYMKIIDSYTGTGTVIDPYVNTYAWKVCFTVAA